MNIFTHKHSVIPTLSEDQIQKIYLAYGVIMINFEIQVAFFM